MQTGSDIQLQEGETILWQGKAHLGEQRLCEYIPALILILVYANSLQLLYPVEPLVMLHAFCSGNLAGGILLLGIVLFAAAPTIKRKIHANQTYIFTNRRALAVSSSGCILLSLPAEQIRNCIIRKHRNHLVSLEMMEKGVHETTTALLFARIPTEVLQHYQGNSPE